MGAIDHAILSESAVFATIATCQVRDRMSNLRYLLDWSEILSMKRAKWPILCVFSLFTFLESITPAYTQPNDFTRFVTQSGGPARLSIFQEIPGFRSSLIDLDKDKNLLDLDGEWYSMSDTDVWVFS